MLSQWVDGRWLVLSLALLTAFPVASCANEIPWSTDIEGSLQQAAASGKPVLLEITAPWCMYCKRMEKTTFVDPSVVQYVNERFVAVRVDADQNKELVGDLAIKGLPAILIVSPDLKIIERIPGFQTPNALLAKLDRIPNVGRPAVANQAVARKQNESHGIAFGQQQAESQQQVASPTSRKELAFEPVAHNDPAPARQPVSVRTVSKPSATVVPAPVSHRNKPPEPIANDFFASISKTEPSEQADEAEEQEEQQVEDPKEDSIDEERPTSGRQVEPQVSFDGTCIVSAVESREIVMGSPRYRVDFQGHVLCFSTEENKQMFLEQPADYWPVLDGMCAITLLNDDDEVPGKLEYAAFFRKRLWVFSSEEKMKEFLEDPAEVAEEIAERSKGKTQQ